MVSTVRPRLQHSPDLGLLLGSHPREPTAVKTQITHQKTFRTGSAIRFAVSVLNYSPARCKFAVAANHIPNLEGHLPTFPWVYMGSRTPETRIYIEMHVRRRKKCGNKLAHIQIATDKPYRT